MHVHSTEVGIFAFPPGTTIAPALLRARPRPPLPGDRQEPPLDRRSQLPRSDPLTSGRWPPTPPGRRGSCGRGRSAARGSPSPVGLGAAARALAAAAHARARRGLLDRRGAVRRDRRPAARRHPRRPAPGRLAAALLHAAALLARARGPLRGGGARALGCSSACSASRSPGGPADCCSARRTAWIAALLAAFNPFLTQYAQEARMYSLVALLGLVAVTCWLHAFTHRRAAGRLPCDPEAPASASRSPRGDALHAQLGDLLRRGHRRGVARAAGARARDRAAPAGCARGCWATASRCCSTCRGCRPCSTRPRTPARRGRTPSLAALASTPAKLLGAEAADRAAARGGAGHRRAARPPRTRAG